MITPFPSEELAKLVLGYLAEEQLMTAYDEFLQASPHLDATRNEYDRIFMTSLKRIMAEYRAAMIYVQNCKPILKDRLIKCKNILEIVKFLVNHVDFNKLRKNDRVKPDSQNESGENSTCEVCKSLLLHSCSCKNQGMETETPHITSTETTLLDNLPGLSKDSVASAVKKKHIKVMEKEANVLKTNSFSEQNLHQQYPQAPNCSNTNLNTCNAIFADGNYRVDATKVPEIQKMELNDFLNLINKKNAPVRWTLNNNSQNVSTAGSFQEFYSGVSGTANMNIQALNSLVNKSISLPTTQSGTNNKASIAQSYKHTCVLLPKPADPKITILSDIRMENSSNNAYATPPVPKNVTSTPMAHTQTIYINGTPAYKDKSNLGMKYNYTKDEIMAMPTIIVVPASAPQVTGISQPASSVTQNTPITTTVGNLSIPLQPLTIDISSDNTDFDNTQDKSLNLINVKNVINITEHVTTSKVPNSVGLVTTLEPNKTTANITGQKASTNSETINTLQLSTQNDIVTNIEAKRISSLPKDNAIDNSSKLSTPHVLPVSRKSSSTPRRSSHIRVLDFTTPRRILGDTIEEHIPSESSDNNVGNVNSEDSKSDNINKSVDVSGKELILKIDKINSINYHDSTKENKCNNKIVTAKKSSWDAELRSLIVNDTIDSSPSLLKETKTKHKTSRKKKSTQSPTETISDIEDKTKGKKLKNKKKTPKKDKKRLKPNEIAETHLQISENVPITLKPNIKIISCNDHAPNSIKEIEKDVNKLSSSMGHIEEKPDTPEMDRISLQSAIGSKLNISDFLETPFKQAIYDIQMETPRFLGPDLPTSDTPLSDIKIMNIPTPRFLESPNLGSKPTQATPSSYSSRPTDYSSGGSYYKPDDQDYIPSPEKLESIITSSEKKDNSILPVNEMLIDKKVNKKAKARKGKPGRPVRRCTRNVSYYRSPANKSNGEDDESKLEKSSGSNKPIVDKTRDHNEEAEIVSEISKDTESTENSIDKVKKVGPAKRGRPRKDSRKPALKIQPKSTPKKRSTKDNCSETPHVSSKTPSRRRMSSKEKGCTSPVVVPAATKSRRKSSTPRKLHCSKSFSSGSTTDNSSDPLLKSNSKQNFTTNSVVSSAQDSDVEQLPLRWSDDGSQEAKNQEVSECDDISKIKDYIQKEFNKPLENFKLDSPCTKTGFDTETAKIIEKDLLGSPHATQKNTSLTKVDIAPEVVVKVAIIDKTVESNISSSVKSQDEDDEDIEFAPYECNEDSDNFVSLLYDYNNDKPKVGSVKIKDKFCMEACIDDGVVVRLRVNQFTTLFEQDSQEEERYDYSYKETEMAVNSISNFDKLYTPLKDSIKAQCYEIFDSTLTSLDTPLKRNRSCSPIRNDKSNTVTEIVLEIEPVIEEKIEMKNVEDKKEGKEKEIKAKRKRLQSGADESDNKRVKTDAQYLLNSANIQNIDIESVLSKLHGP